MNSGSQSEPNFELLLTNAAEGRAQDLEIFFRTFLSAQFHVPLRQQAAPLSHSPKYPNELVSVLGVLDGERTIVPVFSKEEFVAEWLGQELDCHSHSGAALLKLIPEGWWVCINPGQEVEKELSPWEIKKLRTGIPPGSDDLAELIAEQSADSSIDAARFRELSADELLALRNILSEAAEREATIESLTLTCSEEDFQEKTENIYHLGITLRPTDEEPALRIKEAFAQLCAQHMIGSERVKVIILPAKTSQTIHHGGIAPFYLRREPSLLQRLGLAILRLKAAR